MIKKFIYFLLVLPLFIVSCKPSAHELALAEIEKTKQFIAEKQDSAALACIDSIHINYRTDVAVRRMADTLRWDIEYRHAITTLPQIDSALEDLQARLPELTKPFRFIKNDEYQTIGAFEHRQLRTENNTSRCYLKPSIDEHGKFTLTSYYIGSKAQHTIVRATIDSLSIETLVAPSSNISQFVDVDEYKEIIIYDNELLNNIHSFIADNRDNRIKISLLGDGQPYHYYLTPTERNILAQSYELSIALTDLNRLTDQQLKLSQKIELLKMRLNK
ncbi:MAG: hypothetical protein UH103_02595 [Paludibacteraceae bacterium]|nr:hypothetical protein [Paludibacteraceae bacterium]